MSLRLGIPCCALLLSSCIQLPQRPDLPLESAFEPASRGTLYEWIAPQEARHPGQSGVHIVADGRKAFALRVRTARLAVRSLDVQTYIWHRDLTGIYLAKQLMDAADRGVRVRVLIDDMDARASSADIAALAEHPNISVRLFNPFASRAGTVSMAIETLSRFGRINRRMHNKTWIADNRIALLGGRNVGNEYFGADEARNFVDLGLALVGPVVRDASASFDSYWNSAASFPIGTLDSRGADAAALARVRASINRAVLEFDDVPYLAAFTPASADPGLIGADGLMQWTGTYRFLADSPLKVSMRKHDAARSEVGAALLPVVRNAQSRLSIISPYFVPGERVTATLIESAKAGRTVNVLTNSLAATDVAAVHGGYARYRTRLLSGGVNLWELKPLAGAPRDQSIFGSSGASLHAKALIVDEDWLFIGSFNLDPRSTWLNCEQGVLVRDRLLVEQLAQIFSAETANAKAWRVSLKEGRLQWSDGTATYAREPQATAFGRLEAWLIRVLHIEAEL